MRLTDGEKLFLLRRRQGLTQAAYGKRLGLTHDTVSALEHSRGSLRPALRPSSPVVAAPHELVTVLRRRAGLSAAELAGHLGISRVTLLKREHGRGDARPIVAWLREYLATGEVKA